MKIEMRWVRVKREDYPRSGVQVVSYKSPYWQLDYTEALVLQHRTVVDEHTATLWQDVEIKEVLG